MKDNDAGEVVRYVVEYVTTHHALRTPEIARAVTSGTQAAIEHFGLERVDEDFRASLRGLMEQARTATALLAVIEAVTIELIDRRELDLAITLTSAVADARSRVAEFTAGEVSQ